MREIHVAMCSDDFYAPFVSTTISSILMNTDEVVHFYVLSDGISKDNQKRIAKADIVKNKCSKIDFIEIEDKVKNIIENKGHISRVAIARFFIPEIILVDKVVYTDIDVAYTKDIALLWDEDMEGCAFAAVPSQRTRISNNYYAFRKQYGLSEEHIVFMDGLLIIDCNKWREGDYGNRLIDLVVNRQIYDQEAMNVFFDSKPYKKLDPKYCVIYKLLDNCFSIDEADRLRMEQVIVHYPGGGNSKPWYDLNLPSARYFWKSVRQSSFYDDFMIRYGINTVEQLIGLAKKFENVIVYGAGTVGKLVLSIINREEYELDNVFVAVTEKENNPVSLFGRKVSSIDEYVDIRCNSFVIVAVDVNVARDVERTLEEKEFDNVAVITAGLRDAIEKELYRVHDETILDSKLKAFDERINTLFALMNYSIDITTIPRVRGQLRELQIADTVLLKLFDWFCKKNKLVYWLICGTLLGAVRHKGFIPWDDDLDVAMPRESYDRVDEVFERDLERYGFELNRGKGFFHQTKRIIYRDSPIQLDMWPYDGLKSFEGDYDVLKSKMKECHNEFYKRVSIDDLREGKINMPETVLMDLQREKLGEMCAVEYSDVLIEGCEVMPDDGPYVFLKDDIFPLSYIEFEGESFLSPRYPVNICKSHYGDYLSFPSSKILGHSNINEKMSGGYDDAILELNRIFTDYK